MTVKPAPLNPWELSERQYTVMVLLCEHGHNKVIGDVMGVSEATVEQHLSAAKVKLGARHKVQAALVFDRWRRRMRKEGWSKIV